jgi:alanyl-tRNA synthetase
MERTRQRVYDACAVLKTKPAELASKLENQVEEIKALKKAVESYKAKEAAGEVDRFLFGAHNIGGLKVLTVMVPVPMPTNCARWATCFAIRTLRSLLFWQP